MSGWIFKACSRFLYSVVFLGFAACFAPANASVCFLPDADNCGTNDIVTQCDGGQRYFVAKPPAGVTGQTCREKVQDYHSMNGPDGRPRLSYLTCTSAGDCDYMGCVYAGETDCKTKADNRSYKNAHYECYLDTATGCWYQTETPCEEYDYPASNASYPLDSPEDGKACKPYTWDVEHHLCSDKGIASTQKGTRTTYDCVTIVPKVSGCDGYNLSSPISGYDCDKCEPDVYKNDYDGNYNYSGKGNTVYSCSKSEGCSGYSLTASEKATKEASGDYRCHDCTPKVTDSNGNTSTGTTVYKCGKITTSTTTCPGHDVSQADKASKESQGYSCEPCTPTTTYYEDGVEYDTKSNPTVYKCGSICDVHTKKSTDCTGNTNFVSAGANFPGTSTACGDCVDCADENNLPTTSACYGLHLCEGARAPEGETPCMCGSHTYYKKCMVNETCFSGNGESYSANGGYCGDWKYGYYDTGIEKCTKVDDSKVYYRADCTTAKDCEGKPGPAYGLKTCVGNKGIGTPVECGGYKYFSSCECTSGNGESYSANGGYCGDWKYGFYDTGIEKCTIDGSKVYYRADCTTAKDCEGKPGPAYGLTQCASDKKAIGTVVKCGGYEYGTSCVEKVECSFDYTEEICTKDGKDFVQKCKDNDGKWWGECKDKE